MTNMCAATVVTPFTSWRRRELDGPIRLCPAGDSVQHPLPGPIRSSAGLFRFPAIYVCSVCTRRYRQPMCGNCGRWRRQTVAAYSRSSVREMVEVSAAGPRTTNLRLHISVCSVAATIFRNSTCRSAPPTQNDPLPTQRRCRTPASIPAHHFAVAGAGFPGPQRARAAMCRCWLCGLSLAEAAGETLTECSFLFHFEHSQSADSISQPPLHLFCTF
jgi:hypothetical protein